ncbi:unnamed protein product [Symbiodinium natans]|uniref:Uncharacterized protein n=1 Tax=Symbiodinium natans TaxID=878477 RepID=A0A812L4B7_9DINO|nr:unnamed protein product [Symbiodinium natans]
MHRPPGLFTDWCIVETMQTACRGTSWVLAAAAGGDCAFAHFHKHSVVVDALTSSRSHQAHLTFFGCGRSEEKCAGHEAGSTDKGSNLSLADAGDFFQDKTLVQAKARFRPPRPNSQVCVTHGLYWPKALLDMLGVSTHATTPRPPTPPPNLIGVRHAGQYFHDHIGSSLDAASSPCE